MRLKRIAVIVAMLLVAGPTMAQGQGNGQGGGRGQDRRMPLFEQRQDGERLPDATRRERRDRAEERIRERRERRGGEAGGRGRDNGDGIYRRSNNYRRW